MNNTSALKVKDIVHIKSLHHTRDRYQLDSTGYMLKMENLHFPIAEVSGATSIRIYNDSAGSTFIFDIQDIEKVDTKPLKPKIFTFDPKHLEL